MACGFGGEDAEGSCGGDNEFSEESDGCLAGFVSGVTDARERMY